MARHQVKGPALWQVSILTTPEAEEALALSMQQIFNQFPSIYASSGTSISTTTIYDSKPLSSARRSKLRKELRKIEACGLNVRPGTILTRRVRREDWSESWKKYFRTIEI